MAVVITQTSALHARIMLGVFNVCGRLAADLPGIYTDSGGNPKAGSIIQIWADMRTIPPLPAILITIDGLTEKELEDESGTEAIYVMYPVNVLVLAREGWEDQDMLPTYLSWRDVLMEIFRNIATLGEAPEVVDIRLNPRPILEPARVEDAEAYNLVVTGFSVETKATRQRVHQYLTPLADWSV